MKFPFRMKKTSPSFRSGYLIWLTAFILLNLPQSSRGGILLASCLDNAITYLRFSEGSGTTTADEASTRIIDVDGNASWTTTGKVGSGLLFDGISQGLEIDDHPDFDWSVSEDFSIEFWCKTSATDKDLQVIIGRETTGSTHWWVGLNYERKPAFYLYDAAGNGGGLIGPDSINDGEWHHIAAVHIGYIDHNLLYVDGILQIDSTFNYTAGFSSDAAINIAKFYSGLANKFFFDGGLDELAVSNRAIPENELYAHYIKGAYSQDYCADFSLAPIILTEPDTLAMVDQPYVYPLQVEAYPTAAFELMESPAGMSIDPLTGLVRWTPSEAGTYMVSIRVYNAGGNTYQNYNLAVLEPCIEGTASYLRFNEGEGPVTLDEGNLHIVQVQGNALWSDGRIGSGLTFEGNTNGLTLEAQPAYNWEQTQDFTLELWFKTGVSKETLQVLVGRDKPDSTHWWMGLNTDYQATFYLYDEKRNGGGISGTDTLNDGEWHHLAALYKGDRGIISLYVDGALNARDSFAYAADFHSQASVQVASLYYGEMYNFFYEGQIDELLFLDRALTDEEIFMHYMKGMSGAGYCEDIVLAPFINSTPGDEAYSQNLYTYQVTAYGTPAPEYSLITAPEGMVIDSVSGLIEWIPTMSGIYEVEVAASNTGGEDTQQFSIEVLEACIEEGVVYFNFEETEGSVVVDQLSGLEGQLLNTPQRKEGLIGNSILFNGLDQSVLLADDDAFDFAEGSSFSFELWCKPSPVNTALQVCLGRNETDGVHWWIGFQADSKFPVVYVFDENRIGNGLQGNITISDGKWHHLAAIYNSQDEMLRLYIDGSLNTQMEINFTAGFVSSAIVQIGCLFINDDFDYFFEGELDEIVLYKRALSREEIALHYELGSMGYGYCFTEGPEEISSRFSDGSLNYTIYPVPAADKLFIDFEQPLNKKVAIQLISVTGTSLYYSEPYADKTITLDLNTLSAGMYILNIGDGNELLLREVIVLQ